MATAHQLTLVVIRHGQTAWNTQQRFQGHQDSPLTRTGREQATALGRRMQKMTFDRLISSDLGRARETAAIIAEHTSHGVVIDSRLRERNYGVLEGLTQAEIAAAHPGVLDRLYSDDPDYRIPGGESHREHYHRNVGCINELLKNSAGMKIAMVVHGGVLDSLFRYVAQLPLRRPRCFITQNASLGIVTHGSFYGTTRWVIETWGDVGHLDGIERFLGLG